MIGAIRTGLLFGSFNPVHQGHLMLGQYMLQFEEVDEVWFVLSPHNPLKSNIELAPVEHRQAMLQLALKGSYKMKLCSRELLLPIPSYTIHTLDILGKENPSRQFSIIMGTDNIAGIHQWKEYQTILDSHNILVYPRLGYEVPEALHPNVKITSAPMIDLSATTLRSWIGMQRDITYFVPQKVQHYITKNNLYQ